MAHYVMVSTRALRQKSAERRWGAIRRSCMLSKCCHHVPAVITVFVCGRSSPRSSSPCSAELFLAAKMSKPGLKANLSFKSSLNVTSADIDGTTPTLAEFKDLTGVTRQVVQRIFGTGRLFNLGKCLAREGYLSGFPMTVKVSEGTAVIEGKCWASQKKKTNYDVLLVLALASPNVDSECSIIHSKCSCPAGVEKCVHLSALMQFIVARASFWTYLEEEGHSKETSLLSPTSQPCKWSIPPQTICGSQ